MNLNVLSNKLYLLFIYICIFGVTLLFSTATRSVFEVNKLFMLKLTISSLSILYAYDRLIGDKSWFYNIKKNRFFNISLAIVWLSSFLSTIFSKNILISFYGSYDRWEGILTFTLYTLLIFFIANKKGLFNSNRIIWTLIIASSLSCLYGIVQSFGIDIVKWSMDPSMRVFGSINNPVHYCAILGMSIPLVIGQLFFTIKENNNPSPKILNFFIYFHIT